jgi:menaquinone-dependent protoporphyrinogen IX oxidase
MNIGIVVYSRTGHTLSVAKELKEKLSAAGHVVNLDRVQTARPVNQGATRVQLETVPEIGKYDAVVFGCPVIEGAMPTAMSGCISQIGSLRGERVACLVTHFLQPAQGADQTISQMKEMCEFKGATVCGVGNVKWLQPRREQQIADVVEDLGRLF